VAGVLDQGLISTNAVAMIALFMWAITAVRADNSPTGE
jgi:hypothetical protein